MRFRQGQVIKEVLVNGKTIVFRYPKNSDAKALLFFINQLRSEAKWIGNWRKETLKSEKAFLKKTLVGMQKGNSVLVLVESGERVVGTAGTSPPPHEACSHVGGFGIGLLKKYTGLGLGFELGRIVLEKAKRIAGASIVTSQYNADNMASAALHKKLGFKILGKLPKGIRDKKGKYCTEVLLYKKTR